MTSTSIYKDFKPTYLYIKQHSITKKLYFGKTTRNPLEYIGSGTDWKSHLKEYNKEFVETLWYCLFYDKESIVEFAELFSIQENITQSVYWLNRKIENGLDGTVPGSKLSDSHKLKISISGKGRVSNRKGKSLPEEHRLKLCGIVQSKETIKKRTDKTTGMKRSSEQIITNRLAILNSETHKAASRINVVLATEAARIINTGKFWWTNGIISVKSKIKPDENFKRGRHSRTK